MCGSVLDSNIHREQGDNLHLRKRITTEYTNLQLRLQQCSSNRGPGTNKRVMIPVPTLSSHCLSELTWQCKTSLLHNPRATIFCQCWKLSFQCARIKMTNHKLCSVIPADCNNVSFPQILMTSLSELGFCEINPSPLILPAFITP